MKCLRLSKIIAIGSGVVGKKVREARSCDVMTDNANF